MAPSKTPPHDPALLARIVVGDQTLAELTGIEVRSAWAALRRHKCPLCLEQQAHTRQTHQWLLPRTIRQLPRHPLSRIYRCERIYERETGQRLRMEEILRYELAEKTPPNSFHGLSRMFGVTRATVRKWALALGIESQHTMR